VGAHRVPRDQERILAVVGDPELAHLLALLLDLERQQGLGILAPGAKSPGRKPAPAHARPEVAENGYTTAPPKRFVAS